MRTHRLRRAILILSSLVIACICLVGVLFVSCETSLPAPPTFAKARATGGTFTAMNLAPKRIFGMGLTYPGHIRNTTGSFDPDAIPPVFRKRTALRLKSNSAVTIPTQKDLYAMLDTVEPGLAKTVREQLDGAPLPALLDYEVELGLVFLEPIQWNRLHEPTYAPRVGYFLANDLSARCIAVLGAQRDNIYDYWGASKSFPGFLPVGDTIWIPETATPKATFHTKLTTTVNGQLRQSQHTTQCLYTLRDMLRFVRHRYPDDLPETGDILLTGTPGGTGVGHIPAWKRKAASFLDISRFTRLKTLIELGEDEKVFLQPGDVVEVRAGELGTIKTRILAPQ